MTHKSKSPKVRTHAQRCADVASMMQDITGDDDWARVDLAEVEMWLDLGPSWDPTTRTDRELCEDLLEYSVQPCHCGAAPIVETEE